ncbi:glucose 1-dehydrogenase [Streptomyces sp. PSKA54]|uniref:Glucose 1-dehydrogenase n=1 Tax=Streptomyces himalayensis subsp. aureolus TaxID=2758039 RepID=A0A7W2D2H9_9ACTN|nr:glucose 1-dehydrogenase [Streptomyces himalayensis]MBA4863592.1 glucose 1-dehydrogenase [Streptomyces himalayensis subsp. aureolus]
MHTELERAFELAGRTAVVTGAASGIGRQTAITFAQAGADVVLADITESSLGETAASVRQLGRTATVVPTDVSDRTAVDRLAKAALDAHGQIDVWANIAGVIRYGAIADTSEEDLDLILAVNVKGAYWGCAAAARAMTPRGSGSIINVASAGMDSATPGISCYALSKSAVAMLTRTLAAEVSPHGVRANTVAPGWVPTGMTSRYWTNADGTVDEAKREEIFASRASNAPLGRIGDPSDIAWAMLYLAADASRFVTGQVLRPNGGVAMV